MKQILGILQVKLSRYQWANIWIKHVELPYTNRWKSVAGNCLRSQIDEKDLETEHFLIFQTTGHLKHNQISSCTLPHLTSFNPQFEFKKGLD